MNRLLPVLWAALLGAACWVFTWQTMASDGAAVAKRHRTGDYANSAAIAGQTAVNPHWSNDGCSHCHSVRDGAYVPLSRADVDDLCLSCHDGRSAKAEAHPIGRTFVSPQVKNTPDWPTVNGALSCITCHDVLLGCRKDGARPRRNAMFLRGSAMDPAAYCGACHVAEYHVQYNPHVMLTDERAVRQEQCLVCHDSGILDRSDFSERTDPLLRGDEITLCGACHHNHVDFFDPGHIGATVPSPTMATLGAGAVPGSDHQRLIDVLPLLSDNRIGCSTCHNPHQAGLFPSDSPLAFGAISETREPMAPVSTRVIGATLCITCHGN